MRACAAGVRRHGSAARSEQDWLRIPLEIPAAEEIEPVVDATGTPVAGSSVAVWHCAVEVGIVAAPDDGFVRLGVTVDNAHPDDVHGKDEAIRVSLIGTHVLAVAAGAGFVSLLEPPDEAAEPAGALCAGPVLPGAGRSRGFQ